ncbi:MAG: hypothetical protein AAF333_06855 [Planctomycetota bacterium]
MIFFAVSYAILGIGALVVSLFVGPHYRTLGLANLRNIFILGFCYFQFYGIIYPLWYDDFGDYFVADAPRAAGRFVAYSFLYLVCFFLAYNWFFSRPPKKIKPPTFQADLPPVPLLIVAVTVGLAAYFARFSGYVPIFGPLLNHIFTASAAMSGCLAMYVIARNFVNPVLSLPAIGIILLSMFNTILADFGRRGLVGILGAAMWGLYFVRPQTFSSRKVWLVLVPAALIAMTIIGSFSQVRTERDTAGQGGLRVNGIIKGLGWQALKSNFAVPDTGIASLWLIDSRFEYYEYQHMAGLKYFFLHFVPRSVMPDKDEPLSRRIPVEADKRGVALGIHTVGPGIVGHSAADGGFYAAVVYGVLMGLGIGWMDRMLLRNRHSCLAVAAIGSTLGQVVGLSRGDSAIFMGIILIGVIGNLIIMYVVDVFLRASHPSPVLYAPPPGQPLAQPYPSLRNF